MLRISSASIQNSRVLVRVDLNVPIVRRRVRGDFRIRGHLETIRKLRAGGNTVILLSHHSNRAQTLRPVANTMSRIIGAPITFISNPFERGIRFPSGARRIFLFENLRRWKGEESCDPAFAKKIASFGDVFVDDAFSVAHRKAASTILLPKLVPSYLGLLFEHELKELDGLMTNPARPLVAIFGGAKTETKLPLLNRFSRFADFLLVGGAIANTMLRARNVSVGRSHVDTKALGGLKAIARSPKVHVPIDAVVADRKGLRFRTVPVSSVGERDVIWDVGPGTVKSFRVLLESARTVVWNGPLGLVEKKAFEKSTIKLARLLLRLNARVVVGGGDTVAFLEAHRLLSKFNHVSAGGGAMLAYLGGAKLPALEALRKADTYISKISEVSI